MAERTDKTGADVAWARPAEIPTDLILNYSGPAFCGVSQIEAWGKPFLLGYESTTTRAYAGFDAGIVDAQQLLSVALTIPGYDGCGFWACAADSPSTPAWALGGITDYFRAFRSIVGSVALLAYGNRDAVTAALAGGASHGWGVGTWGYGEGNLQNRPPADSDAALVQSGNTPGPADGTDLNWVYIDLADLAPLGGPTPVPTPAPAPPEESDMLEVTHLPFKSMLGDRRAILWGPDGKAMRSWFGPNNGLGGVQAAYDEAPQGTPHRIVRSDDPGDPIAMQLVALADNAPTPAEATVKLTDAQLAKIGAGVSIDYGAVAKAVNDDAAARLAKV